ncbi:uncharacterized protein LOC128388676 [Panonychus citri]|uniref:uncharacterized protein LOC128388676 n=1 Tax=Panonychus citri TaxID=50023 RepID=UPI0023070B55|nr:uncharacterized protein LOC128388676 [Panonychus citri]
MDDIDLYGDLDFVDNKCVPSVKGDGKQEMDQGDNLNDIAILQDSHDKLEKENEKIIMELGQIKEQLARMTRVNKILKSNISSLYKTAKAELDRKNDRIAELTRQYDDLIFRRHQESIHR